MTALAYETIEVNRRLPLLEPMSEIAGRMSVLVGGYFLAKHCGGSGVLLGGVPGVLPGRVVVHRRRHGRRERRAHGDRDSARM